METEEINFLKRCDNSEVQEDFLENESSHSGKR